MAYAESKNPDQPAYLRSLSGARIRSPFTESLHTLEYIKERGQAPITLCVCEG